MATTTTNPALVAMLAQYEKNATSYSSEKKYDLKNYFTTHLKDGVKTATRKIRILPGKDGQSPFVEMYGHKIKVGKETKTFACLKHEKNQACPFCEAREELLGTGTEKDKELAKNYNAKKMYIVKVIDRELEADGPKFWRFNHDYRKTGIYDKIYGVLQTVSQDITSPENGRDLNVLISRDTNNYPVVSTISQFDPSPLSTDTEKVKSWLEDTRTWEDVYSVRNYEYLEIIVKGGIPVFDKVKKKFVDKASLEADKNVDDDDSEETLGSIQQPAAAQTSQVVTNTVSSDLEDELPF